MKLIFKYLKAYRLLFVLDIFCALGFLLTELGLPYIFSLMVDHAILTHHQQRMIQYLLLMLLVIIVGISLSLILSVICSKITTGIITKIRDDLFEKIQNYSHEEYELFGNASLLTRMTNDPIQILNFLNVILRMGITAPLMFIGSMSMIYVISHSLAIVVLCGLPFLILGVVIMSRWSEPLSARQQKALDSINAQMQENLLGMRVIRAFNRQSFEQERFDLKNKTLTKRTKALNLLMAISNPAFNIVFLMVLSLVLWIGTKQISMGMIPVGSFVAITEYIFHALYSTMLFATVFMMYPRAKVSANRILEVLNTVTPLEEGTLELKDELTTITFKDVSFRYPGENKNTLKHLSFEAKTGEMIAFVGSIGSGKSSVLKLIARLYDIERGQILINHQDIRKYTLNSLRQHLGYIPQKAFLFNGTIRDNLKYGKEDATDSELWEALTLSQAKDFVQEKTEQLSEVVVENGSNFSGGQKQRLAIARAIVRKPDVYLFDDSFSALDFKTDAILRKDLAPILSKAITFIVAQRVSTVMAADQIIVLDHGEIVAKGCHETLMEQSDIYREIVASQLEGEDNDEQI